MGYAGAEAAEAVAVPESRGGASASAAGSRVSQLAVAEHPAVVGARIGACLFNSLGLPTLLWAIGGVSVLSALGLAAALTLLCSRTILAFGGLRIGRVLAVEILATGWALHASYPVLILGFVAVSLPLLGMLASVMASARIASVRFARSDHHLQEADAAVARASQANVVDIRAAGAARRIAERETGLESPASTVAASVESQAG